MDQSANTSRYSYLCIYSQSSPQKKRRVSWLIVCTSRICCCMIPGWSGKGRIGKVEWLYPLVFSSWSICYTCAAAFLTANHPSWKPFYSAAHRRSAAATANNDSMLFVFVGLVGSCDAHQWVVKMAAVEVHVHAPFCHHNHEFFKYTLPLEKPLNQHNKRVKLLFWLSRLPWESVEKEHSLLLWCYWCTHINDGNLTQRHFSAGLLPAASAVCLLST